ncbi:ATP-dependent DNA helicase Q4-like [Centruroides sculpturatus]|uniref:ATP-dependent DNA helicase Q4-like n=1 Tax=Centruroides sculpturatus TaxID=218467 RepID=UPI000C6D1D44|nr:ATP-dependent DNA helicase Q4-like [Centruroides sculpturatus]
MEEKTKDDLMKLKIKIKKWESNFYRQNKRKPDKNDVKNASEEIQEWYETYWHLRNNSHRNKICLAEDNEVFSSSFNKSSKSENKSILSNVSSTLSTYSHKLQQYAKKQDEFLKMNLHLKPDNNINNSEENVNLLSSDLKAENDKNVDNNTISEELIEKDNNYLNVNNMQLSNFKIYKYKRPINAWSLKNSNKIQNKFLHYQKNKIDIEWLERCLVEEKNEKENHFQDLDRTIKTNENQVTHHFEELSSNNNRMQVDSCENVFENRSNKKEIALDSDNSECQNNDNQYCSGNDHQSPLIDSLNREEIKETNNNLQNNKTETENIKFSHLKRKLSTGTINENYIKINIKKKKFVRGYKHFSIKQYKKVKWKNIKKQKEGNYSVSSSTCFNCNRKGHWSRNCPERKDTFLEEMTLSGDLPLPTLQEAKDLAQGFKTSTSITRIMPKETTLIQIESILNKTDTDSTELNNLLMPQQTVSPVFNLLNGKVIKTPNYTFLEEMTLSGDLPLPTLQEAKDLAQGFKTSTSITRIMPKETTLIQIESILNKTDTDSTELNNLLMPQQTVSPVFNLLNGKVIKTPNCVFQALHKMGHSIFRSGQEEAIMRILSGLSSLIISSTGSGKSLCYQLPAYIYAQHFKCFTLVISPLVSLMEDQIKRLPQCIKAVCVHSGMNVVQRQEAFEAIINGEAQILLLSSEAIVGYENSNNFLPSNLPPIAFACIDEAHCLSEWSHNFRPSYLQLRKVLTKKLGVKCLLALTATATKYTAVDIAQHLEIDIKKGIIGETTLPENLFLSVSCPKYRDEAIIELLKDENFVKCNSIIIYCTRREDTERLASFIRTQMQYVEICPEKVVEKNGKRKKRILNWNAGAYHAGLTMAQRKTIQNSFMSGKANDMNELQRHIYANSIDRHVIRRFLAKLFNHTKVCPSKNISQNTTEYETHPCLGHEIAIPIEPIVQDLDIKEENLLTLLCYIEINYPDILEVLCPIHAYCSINCYKGYKQLVMAAKKCAPLAAALALNQIDINKDKLNQVKFSVIEIAAEMDWDSKLIIKALKKLEWDNENSEKNNKKTGIIVKFSDLSFHIRIKCNLNESKKDELLEFLYNKVIEQERYELNKLQKLHSLFNSVSFPTITFNSEQSTELKTHLCKYFKSETKMEIDSLNKGNNIQMESETLDEIRNTISNLVCTYQDQNFTGRAVARILHGIGSPRFPSEIWSRVHKFWRCYLNVDFNYLIQIANQEILRLR